MRAIQCLRRIFVFVLGVASLMVVAQPALAKGPPDRVTINGPELQDEIEVTDQDTLKVLALGTLEDLRSGAIEAPQVSDGYEVTRYFKDGSKFRAFDQVRYYPNPSGERGYVFYIGIVGGWSEYDGKWFRVSEQSEQILQEVLANNGVQLRGVPASAPATLPVTGGVSWSSGLLIILGGMLVLTGWLLRLNHSLTGHTETAEL